MRGKGSKRASALRMGPDGGSRPLSARRMLERWMSSRSPWAWGAWRTTDPASHTSPSATPVLSTAPASPSTIPSDGPVMRRRSP